MKYKLFSIPILGDYKNNLTYFNNMSPMSKAQTLTQTIGYNDCWLVENLIHSELFRALVDD